MQRCTRKSPSKTHTLQACLATHVQPLLLSGHTCAALACLASHAQPLPHRAHTSQPLPRGWPSRRPPLHSPTRHHLLWPAGSAVLQLLPGKHSAGTPRQSPAARRRRASPRRQQQSNAAASSLPRLGHFVGICVKEEGGSAVQPWRWRLQAVVRVDGREYKVLAFSCVLCGQRSFQLPPLYSCM